MAAPLTAMVALLFFSPGLLPGLALSLVRSLSR